jgi:hypothetical protein
MGSLVGRPTIPLKKTRILGEKWFSLVLVIFLSVAPLTLIRIGSTMARDGASALWAGPSFVSFPAFALYSTCLPLLLADAA